jgi:LPXTG-motif cell wall-anchored protein
VLRRILPDAGAWWAVWLAFALLGSGVLLAVRRARQGA